MIRRRASSSHQRPSTASEDGIHVDDLTNFITAFVRGSSLEPFFPLLRTETAAELRSRSGKLDRATRKTFSLVARRAPDAAQDLAERWIRGETSLAIPLSDVGGMASLELVESQMDMEHGRLARRAQLRNPRDGRSDPWAVSHILSVDFWELQEPSIFSGSRVIWISAQRTYGYRFRRGEARCFNVLRSDYGFNPLTEQLRDSLLEASADFRRHRSDGMLREVERP
jgi:hypothetical protein